VTPLNGDKIILISSVCIVKGNGQVSFDFLTTNLEGAKMFPLIQKQINWHFCSITSQFG